MPSSDDSKPPKAGNHDRLGSPAAGESPRSIAHSPREARWSEGEGAARTGEGDSALERTGAAPGLGSVPAGEDPDPEGIRIDHEHRNTIAGNSFQPCESVRRDRLIDGMVDR